MKTFKSFFILFSTYFVLILTSCDSDTCENSLCLNGGVCMEGSCDCPDKFTGPDCSEQKTPDKIEIRSIQVTNFPGSNEGTAWDINDGPDLYFRLYEGETPLAQPMIPVDDADYLQDHFFFVDQIFMKNVLNEHSLQLRDYDAEDDDEILGEVKFIPYESNNGFPAVITWDNGTIAFTAEIDYIYNKVLR